MPTFHNRAPYNAHIRTAHSTPQPAAARKRPATKTSDAPSSKTSKRSEQASANTASEPSTTTQFTPQPSTATAGSSWEANPVLIPTNLVPSSETDIADVYRQHWPQIRTRFSHHNRLQDWYNFRLSTISPTALREQLSRTFSHQPTVFKVNFAFGFILRNTETGALQYHHPSANNNLVLEQPFLHGLQSQRFRACKTEWSGLDSSGRTANGLSISSQMSHGSYGKFAIIRSVEENIYPITWWKTEESSLWTAISEKQALSR